MESGIDSSTQFLTLVVSSVVALPATVFFLYAAGHGAILLLRSALFGFVKSVLLLLTAMATFAITYHYFMLDESLLSLYPDLRETHAMDGLSMAHLHATSSHTFCLLLGILTCRWLYSHTRLSVVSRALFQVILISMFFIGCFTWFFFFYDHITAQWLVPSGGEMSIPKACSHSLSHWLSFVVGICMFYDYYRRGFHQPGQETAMIQYYTSCGIALVSLPHAWKTIHGVMGCTSLHPLMSPNLWSFLFIFLVSVTSLRRLGYYAVALFGVAGVSIFPNSPWDEGSVMATSPPSDWHPMLTQLFENPESNRMFAVILVGVFGLAIMAEFIVLFHSATNTSRSNAKKSRSRVPRLVRGRPFPPPCPNGWYRLMNSEEVPKGAVKFIRICGLDLVVFRGEDGQVGILDAYCPHLGANLAIGGQVKGNCVECPFHGWQFDREGTCQHIPYTTAPVPSVAKTSSYPVLEYATMICFFFHAEKQDPDYHPIPLPEVDSGRLVLSHTWDSELAMHLQDFAENAADYAHFDFVHDDLDVPVGKDLFFISHRVTWHAGTPDDPSASRFAYFTDDTRVHCKWFPSHPFPQYVQPLVLFNGPGLVYFRFTTPWGDILLLKSFQVVDNLKLHVQDRFWADPRLPRMFVRFVAAQALHAFLDDVTLWENKSYSHRPVLVKGDGPMRKVRQWFTQFYTDNSPRSLSSPLDW